VCYNARLNPYNILFHPWKRGTLYKLTVGLPIVLEK
jgi:hypothetical protein